MIQYELLILLAIFAFVYSNILTEPNMVLSWWYKFLYRTFKTDKRLMDGKGYHPLFMVLVHCEKCIAGQLALWITLYANYFDIRVNGNYDCITEIILSITFTILITLIIKNSYNRYIKYE